MEQRNLFFPFLALFILSLIAIFLIFFDNKSVLTYQFYKSHRYKPLFFLYNRYIINSSSINKKEGLPLNTNQEGLKNYLFLGIAGEGSRGSYLTDTIIVISINEKNKTINLISIPRDLLVKIPNLSYSSKINSLFEIENSLKKKTESKTFNLVKEKINQITGLNIEEVIVLDLIAVKNIVDQLGGIDIYLEKDVYDPYLVNPLNPSQIFYLKAGWQHLNGDMLLKLIRTRYAPEGDFYRMKNQQMMLLALKNKLEELINNLSIISLIQTWQSLSGHYFTSLSYSDLINLFNSFKKIKNYQIKNIIIDSKDSALLISSGYYDDKGNYVYSLIPKAGFEDYSEIQKFIHQKIYEEN